MLGILDSRITGHRVVCLEQRAKSLELREHGIVTRGVADDFYFLKRTRHDETDFFLEGNESNAFGIKREIWMQFLCKLDVMNWCTIERISVWFCQRRSFTYNQDKYFLYFCIQKGKVVSLKPQSRNEKGTRVLWVPCIIRRNFSTHSTCTPIRGLKSKQNTWTSKRL